MDDNLSQDVAMSNIVCGGNAYFADDRFRMGSAKGRGQERGREDVTCALQRERALVPGRETSDSLLNGACPRALS